MTIFKKDAIINLIFMPGLLFITGLYYFIIPIRFQGNTLTFILRIRLIPSF